MTKKYPYTGILKKEHIFHNVLNMDRGHNIYVTHLNNVQHGLFAFRKMYTNDSFSHDSKCLNLLSIDRGGAFV
jgi:hypothetical protein